MSYVGINIGALTVKVVALRRNARSAHVIAHQGRPLEVLEQLLAAPEFAGAEYFGVSGQMGHISEFAAIQRALHELRERAEGEFDAVASLGGESFLVYTLADGRVTNVLSHNKCAAGSGEFFVQLIGRMGLDIDTAIGLSSSGKRGAAGFALHRALQVRRDAQAESPRGHARRHPEDAARKHGRQSCLAPRERTNLAAARAADRRRDAQCGLA